MERQFYKSLDRQFEIFGLRGAWVKVALIAAGASFILGLLVGAAFGTGIGLATVAVCVVGAFFGSMTLQSRTPGRQLDKQKVAAKGEGWVLRRETLSRILLKDPHYEEQRRRERERNSN